MLPGGRVCKFALIGAVVQACSNSTPAAGMAAGGATSVGGSTSAGGSTLAGGSTGTILTATAVALGQYHACALLSGGTVRCWGENTHGQLGDGTTVYPSVPAVQVTGITDATGVTADDAHTCALLGGGTVQCWGENTYGQLGDGTTVDRTVPVTVTGITNATAVTAGFWYTCAVLADGSVQCWGGNTLTPDPVSGIANATAVTGGTGHNCALLVGGAVKCWGMNDSGQLGDGTTTYDGTPVTVSGITNAIAVVSRGQHACALLSGGTVQCWGDNTYGALGDGTTVNRSVPVTVTGITNAVAVAAGTDYSCALLSGGTVQCWGVDGNGQLGADTTEKCGPQGMTNVCSLTAVPVSSVTNATAISGDVHHNCAVLADGAVWCWGQDYGGELGTRYEF